jgi:peptidoglycan/xylan/chitin deacetylase (PgdA/CDA1 family)
MYKYLDMSVAPRPVFNRLASPKGRKLHSWIALAPLVPYDSDKSFGGRLVMQHHLFLGTRAGGLRALLGGMVAALTLAATVSVSAAEPSTGGTVTFTFDDYFVDDWHSVMPLFNRFNAKVTFFISNYADFNAKQKAELHELAENGHEIAAHALTHGDARCYPGRSNNCPPMDPVRRAQAYMAEEILTELAMMAKDGFYPKNFAYPYGSDTPETTRMLRGLFRFVRGTHYKPVNRALLQCDGNGYIGAMGMDVNYGLSDAEYDAAFDLAKSQNAHLVFYGHRIYPQPNHPENKYYITKERLESLFERAKARGLQFRRLQDVCEDQPQHP